MQGQILHYSVQTNQGVITGDDGNRYSFAGSDWGETTLPARGMLVDFEVRDTTAVGIYLALANVPGGGAASGDKNKIVAGILGILVGAFGIHKFYLGYTRPGVIMLLCGTIGACLIVPIIVVSVIGLVEGIIYLTKSDAEFEQEYVLRRKDWF